MSNYNTKAEYGYMDQLGDSSVKTKFAAEHLTSQDIREYEKDFLESGKFFDAAKASVYGYSNQELGGYYGSLADFKNLDIITQKNLNTPYLTKTYPFLTSQDPYGRALNTVAPETLAIREEKSRIDFQRKSRDYSREIDHFGIGTVYLRIPPTQINVSEDAHNYRLSTLRSPGETIATSGRTTKRIELDLVFTGLDDINNKLRPLIAQFKTTPFLPIESPYLRMLLNPNNAQIIDTSYLENVERQQAELEKRAKEVDALVEMTNGVQRNEAQIREKIAQLVDSGYMKEGFDSKDYWFERVRNPDKINKSELEESDMVKNKYNMIDRVNLAHFIKKHMTFQVKDDVNFYTVERNLNEISVLQDQIDALNSKASDLAGNLTEDRFKDKQIAAVLSQIAMSVAPGFPDTIQCRLTMYVFSYEPFSLDFLFISGSNNNSATPDITKCDLFVDWYTKRFLADRRDPEKPSLSKYEAKQDILFRYFKKINPVGAGREITYDDIKNLTEVGEFRSGEGFYPTGITVSIKNIIQFLPILSHSSPTCQYMGSLNSDAIFTFECTQLGKLSEFYRMVAKIRSISRAMNRVTRNNFVFVDNDFIRFLGMQYFMIDNVTIDTVPGNPGLYSVSMGMIEYKVGQQKLQKLTREGVINRDDPKKAARYILEQANKYALDMAHNPSLKKYYDMVMDPKNGWFKDGSNMVNSFMGGVGKDETVSQEIKKMLLNRCPEVTKTQWFANKLGNLISSSMSVRTGLSPEAGKLAGLTLQGAVTALAGFYPSFNNVRENPEILERDYGRYSTIFQMSIGEKDAQTFFEDNKDIIAEVAAIMDRNRIVNDVIFNSDYSDLNEYLNKNRSQEEIDKGKAYCYPDLELPRYSEIPNGFRIKNTKEDIGLPRTKYDGDVSIQSDAAEVDPDFYFYKGSLWKNVDADNPTAISIDNGLNIFNDLALSNKKYRQTGAIDEMALTDELNERYAAEQRNRFGGQKDYYLSTDEIKELDWAQVKDIKVYDGDTILGTVGGKTVRVRLEGIDTPEMKRSPDGKKPADPVNANKARDLLISLTSGENTIVRMTVPTGQKDRDRIIGVLYASRDGGVSWKNINLEMLDKGKDFKIRRSDSTQSPLDIDYDMAFRNSHENFVYNMISKNRAEGKSAATKKRERDYLVVRGLSLIAGSGAAGVISAIGEKGAGIGTSIGQAAARTSYTLTRAISNILKANKTTASNVALEETALVVGENVSSLYELSKELSPIELEPILTNDPYRVISKGVTSVTPNNNYNRFDREAPNRIALLSRKIRESQKDDALRISRAFPTFKLYFIEEDMPEWGRLDDYYSYQAINSIEITKSRQEPADVAVISMLNTQGTLDKSYFGLHDNTGLFIQRQPDESLSPADQETAAEQQLETFILKPGTIIKIKMGYHSDPDLLEDVFIGMVAEVSGGDMISVVAQGFGVELLHNVEKPMYWTEVASAFKVLDRLITSPEVKHFGKLEWLPEESSTSKRLFRRSVYDTNKREYVGAAWWRNIGGIRQVLALVDDQRNNNIWVPENSWMYNMVHGGNQAFVTKDKTIWDVFREMQRRMPGYITTVLPFDNRATIYFGPADFMYWYTTKKRQEKYNVKQKYDQDTAKSTNDKVNEMLNDKGYKKINPEDVNVALAKAAKFLSNVYNDPEVTEKFKNDALRLASFVNGSSNANKDINIAAQIAKNAVIPEPLVSAVKNVVWVAGKSFLKDEAKKVIRQYGKDVVFQTSKSFLDVTAQSLLKGNEEDIEISKALNFISDGMSRVSDPMVTGDAIITETGKIGFTFKYTKSDPIYVTPRGDYRTAAETATDYDTKIKGEFEESDPQRKLVRAYHFKDSLHHIIANSIVASDAYLYNKVTVEFGLEVAWKARNMLEATPAFGRVSSQVDDDIWPEKVKEKVVQERNAREIITAWNYALGNLWEEFRKMYTGHLTILGDPTIKPYDIVMFNDYFTDMHGPIEVEQVTHHFSQETGFVTTIVPNLMCYVNNSLQQGSMVVAGAYMDSVSEFVQKVRTFSTGGLPIPILGNAAANVAFWMSGLSTGRREPISFTPLIYAGRPYIAGVEGMKKSSIIEAVRGSITRFIINKQRVTDTIDKSWNYLRLYAYERMQNIPK